MQRISSCWPNLGTSLNALVHADEASLALQDWFQHALKEENWPALLQECKLERIPLGLVMAVMERQTKIAALIQENRILKETLAFFFI